MNIPVIDLFAGPGGLGEGFSSLRNSHGEPLFQIRLSVEKDLHAHKTLELRSFFRQFPDREVPKDYYRYICGEGITRDELFAKYEQEAKAAQKKSWRFELAEKHTKEIDIRIEEALNGEKVWILIGGPPCQAYSVVGRARMRGQDPEKFENDPRHYLYREYLRILATHRPPVFVIENVPGLISSETNGEPIFEKILSDLSLSRAGNSTREYSLYPLKRSNGEIRYQDYVVHAEKHDIPQRRHRLIIIGIRHDLSVEPGLIEDQQRLYTVRDAIQDLPRVRSALSNEVDTYSEWSKVVRTYSEAMCVSKSVTGDLRLQFEAVIAEREVLTLGGEFVAIANSDVLPSKWLQEHAWWFMDERLRGYCNHSTRSHIRQDICRYLYAACYAKARGISPRMRDFPEEIWPAHRNIGDAVAGRMFSDRFRVQLADSPATTVVSHISKDGHYYIHPDPAQCRSLTVREAARLQTFPDNYFFCGPKTAQYTQVGNAVPPLLARQIGDIIWGVLQKGCRG